MKPRLLEHVVCPLDGGPLELVEWGAEDRPLTAHERRRAEEQGIDPATLEREIHSGLLVNRRRQVAYPIHQGVPRLLTFPTGVATEFLGRHGERLLRELPGFDLPRGEAMPGERELLRSYSSMWVDYGWDGHAYWNLTAEGTHRAMSFMLDLEKHPVRGRRVLEVGIGIGAFADHMAGHHGCELVGIDLSYAADAAYANFGGNPFLHIVQASANRPPIKPAAFDLVYSHGVILCSFSTRHAFEQLAPLARSGGRTYIWVYSMANERRTVLRRILMLLERMVRPVLSRLPTPLQTAGLVPFIPLYLLHQNVVARGREEAEVRYGLREALHAARDRFTPRFLHRHDEEEMALWFREAGYADLELGGERRYPDYVPLNFKTNSSVTGVRR